MSIRTPVIGPVVRKVAEDVTDPPGPPPHSGQGRSDFEISISALDPIAHYRFRDPNFNQRIRDVVPGGKKHLLKQIAAATRSSVQTRTTHPGGALFPSVTYDNWATQGTFYKRAAENLLSGATEYTALISFRMIKAPSSNFQKVFGLGTENVAETGDNDLAFMKASNNAPTNPHYWKHRRADNGLIPADFAVTELLEDGVNRLATVRFDSGTLFRLMTSKPGHEALVEESVSNSSTLKALSRALLLNARSDTGTGPNTTLEMVVDQIALFDTDIGATAEADLHSKWMDEVAGAGYYPSMMQFDGSTGYYSVAHTSSGNLVTCVARINRESFTGDAQEVFMHTLGSSTRIRASLGVYSSDFSADTTRQNKMTFICRNSSNNNLCLVLTSVDICDGEDHLIFAEFNATTGAARLYVDGVDADNSGWANRVETTGTLESGLGSFRVGGDGGTTFFDGNIGFVGMEETSGLDPDDFMDGNLPKPIDEKNWTEFGGQPLFFAHDGDVENNKGSAGDMTKNGTVTRTTGGSP